MKYSLGGVAFAALFLFGMVGTFTGIAVFFVLAIICAPLTIVGMLVSDVLYARTIIPLDDIRRNYIADAKTNELFELR